MSLFLLNTLKLKRAAILTLLMIITAVSSVQAQDEKVTLPNRNTTIGELIGTIQQQTDYKFVFDAKTFDLSRNIVLGATDTTVKNAVESMIEETRFSYMIKDIYIVINSAPKKQEQPKVIVQRTGDTYQKSNPDDLNSSYLTRPEDAPVENPVEIPEPVIEAPAYYSSYTDPNLYAPMQYDLPRMALKINLLYGLGTLTPNLAAEVGINKKSTIELAGSYHPWNRIGTLKDNKKFVHWYVRPEYRLWTCERFNGHFFGANLFYSKYNISGYNVLWVFDKQYRYEGSAYGGGITYGYHLPIGKKWGLEFNVGVGVAHLKYDQFDCKLCDRPGESKTKTYIGPTRAGVTLTFNFK